MLWAPNCGYLLGAGLYLLFVPVSVVFATGLAYFLTGTGLRRPSHWFVMVGVVLLVAGPAYDLGFHPQFFTYNHVFGGILGPIYDEQLAIRPGLFWFRGVTLLWTLGAVLVGMRLRGEGGRWITGAVMGAALLIGISYLFSARLGFNVTEAYLKQALPGTRTTTHFEIHYDPGAHSDAEVRSWARMQEFGYAELADRLSADPAADERILTFVYPSPRVKARLTGARTTSVAPVWLSRAQSHVLVGRLESSFQHELAHLFARPYGLPGLNASWSVGLVEGWAVALEPPTLAPSSDDLVRAARGRTGLSDDLPSAVASRLSPFGFWTDRGAVSYTTMGSFVRYLLERYGPEPLKSVYATAAFESVYGKPVRELAEEWSASLEKASTIDAEAGGTAARWFSRPSLFETECPHYVPPYRRRIQQAQRELAAEDSVDARRFLQEAVSLEPRSANAHVRLARLLLAMDSSPASVLEKVNSLDPEWHTPSVTLLRADLTALTGDLEEARRLYAKTTIAIPSYETDARANVMLRSLSASSPSLTRLLTIGGTAEEKARRFAHHASTASGREAILGHIWAAWMYRAAHDARRVAEMWGRILPDRPRHTRQRVQDVTNEVVGDRLPRAWQVALSDELLRSVLHADMRTGRAERVGREAKQMAAMMQEAGAKQEARVWLHLAAQAEWVEQGEGRTQKRDDVGESLAGG